MPYGIDVCKEPKRGIIMEERVSRLEVDDKGANEKEACRI